MREIGAQRADGGGLAESFRRKGCTGGGLGPRHGPIGEFEREPAQQRGSVAQAESMELGAKLVQCFATSTGRTLSGRSVGGAVQGGSASGRMRRLRINIAPPKRNARPVAVRVPGPVSVHAQPRAAGAAIATAAKHGGCCGAKSRNFWPIETPWARHAATATTGNPAHPSQVNNKRVKTHVPTGSPSGNHPATQAHFAVVQHG
jgi:hypothetical protein